MSSVNCDVYMVRLIMEEKERAMDFHLDRNIFDISGDYFPFYSGTKMETELRGLNIIQRIVSVAQNIGTKMENDHEYDKLALTVLGILAPISINWHGAKMVFWINPLEEALSIYKEKYVNNKKFDLEEE